MPATREKRTRTNTEWIAELQSDGNTRMDAIEDLRTRIQWAVYYYLRRDRSDLSDLSSDEIMQMAQDFTQDALLKVLDNLNTFRGESKLTTWATKIAIRVAISAMRRARYKDYSLEKVTLDGKLMPSYQPSTVMPTRQMAPDTYTEYQELLTLVNYAIDNVLTEKQRTALVAITIDEVPYEVVADRMATNRNALYKLVHDARSKLKEFLEVRGITTAYIDRLFAQHEFGDVYA